MTQSTKASRDVRGQNRSAAGSGEDETIGLMPLLDAGRRKVGADYFLGFSPECTDPGNEKHSYRQIPKIVGGVTWKCGELSARLYQTVVDKFVTVSRAPLSLAIRSPVSPAFS